MRRDCNNQAVHDYGEHVHGEPQHTELRDGVTGLNVHELGQECEEEYCYLRV